MSDLKKLTDQALIESTDQAVAREREALILVLEHLREIERRRLFSALGFSSLFGYAVKRLKFSEDQAYRRLSAMRMMNELPEIEEKIESGALTLTNLGFAQSLFRSEKKLNNKPVSREQKAAILAKLEHKSKREAEQIVLKESNQPALLQPDKVKTLSEEYAVVQFTADKDLLSKIERLKGLLAHSHPDLDLAELMNKLCDLGLERFDPARAPKRKTAPARKIQTAPNQPVKIMKRSSYLRPHISASVRRETWIKCDSQCARCGSKRALQVEHIHPIAQGGTNDPSNLTLLCRPCNQRTAIEKFGLHQMDRHLNPAIVRRPQM